MLQKRKVYKYNPYNEYKNYNMENTTIAVSNDIKEQIKEFGGKGETYSEILARLLASARKRQLHDILMNEENTTPVKEALAEARRRWPK
ncbi:MAG: hypothetical protein EPN88_01115 [Bacteroidetes bacterium]|nr:MAG: hypothetical protein EPN88_01115 [Bacteroidota bacterium]